MSRSRRLDAAETRADRAYLRRNILEGVDMLRRTPVKFLSEPEEVMLLGVPAQLARPAVLMPGHDVPAHKVLPGVVIDGYRRPDWEMALRPYAEFITDNPRPLTKRQRAKMIRRG